MNALCVRWMRQCKVKFKSTSECMTHFASLPVACRILIANHDIREGAMPIRIEPQKNSRKMLNYQIGKYEKNAVETLQVDQHQCSHFALDRTGILFLLFIRVILNVKSESVRLHKELATICQVKACGLCFGLNFLFLAPEAICCGFFPCSIDTFDRREHRNLNEF